MAVYFGPSLAASTTSPASFSAEFFWPIFSIGGWGIGLVSHWYAVYHANTITEDQIQREMNKLP